MSKKEKRNSKKRRRLKKNIVEGGVRVLTASLLLFVVGILFYVVGGENRHGESGEESQVSANEVSENTVSLHYPLAPKVAELSIPEYDDSLKEYYALPLSIAIGASAKIVDETSGMVHVLLPEYLEADDHKAYLFAIDPFEYHIPEGAKPIASVWFNRQLFFTFDHHIGSEDTLLYKKFVAAVYQNGTLVELTNPQYFVNPEAVAKYTREYVPYEKTCQTTSMHNILLEGEGSDYDVFQPLICLLSSQDVNAVTVNPLARETDEHKIEHAFYMLNAYDKDGVDALVRDCEAMAKKGGQTYIVMNEVNERIWNYMAFSDWDTYVREYYQAFRVCYNAIKSQNANAKVMLSIGMDWNRDNEAEYYRYIDEIDFCDLFNGYMLSEGNVDWDIALHPYLAPLTYAKFWDMSGTAGGAYCKTQVDQDKMVTFLNMTVITDYLTQKQFLNPVGDPRYFIISEIGVSCLQGGDVQAASLCAMWYSYQNNPYVKELYYCDIPGYGVNPTFTGKGVEVWNALGTDAEDTYMDWAKTYIGIKEWSEVIR